MLNLDVAMRCSVEQVRISHWMRGPMSPLTRRNPTLHTAEECLPEVLLDPFFAEDAHYISSPANNVPVSIEQPPQRSPVGTTSQPSSPTVTVPVPPSDMSLPFETNPFNDLSLSEGAATLNPVASNPFLSLSPTCSSETPSTNPTNPHSEPSCLSEANSALTSQATTPNKSSPAKPSSLATPSTPGTPKTKEVHRRKKTAVALLHQRRRILDDPSSVIITTPTPLVKPTSIKQKISSAGKKLVKTISKHASPTSE